MIKGKTKSGFEFEIDENVFDDWELLKNIRAIDKGESSLVVDVVETILGEQAEALESHLKEMHGKVTITAMEEELEAIFEASDSSKN